jgi:hypothetical protein
MIGSMPLQCSGRRQFESSAPAPPRNLLPQLLPMWFTNALWTELEAFSDVLFVDVAEGRGHAWAATETNELFALPATRVAVLEDGRAGCGAAK